MLHWKNTEEVFGSIARGFHWSMALIIFGLLILGFWMVAMPVSPFKFELYGWHKSFGLLVLTLGVMRLMWRFITLELKRLPSHAQWERFLSKTIHLVLYMSIIGMPLSGWLMSSAGEYAVNFFGLFDIPALTGKNEAVYKFMKTVHELLAFTLIGALGLHIAGVLKHHLLDRDETLARMGGNIIVVVSGLFLLSVSAFFAGQHVLDRFDRVIENSANDSNESVQVQVKNEKIIVEDYTWVIDSEQSALGFQFSQYGQDVTGTFSVWSGAIVFDSENLEEASARIEIDIAGIGTGSADRDQQAVSQEWFAAQDHPRAVFESESFEALGANRYGVKGRLTLRGVQLPVSFPFLLEISEKDGGGQLADMSANFTLQRLDFGIGQGQWKSTDAIGNAVDIEIKLQAEKLI